MGNQATGAVPRLTDLLHDSQDEVRVAAAKSLGALRLNSSSVVPELAQALVDDSPRVVGSIGWALSQYAAEAESAVPAILEALRTAFVECHDSKAEHLVVALGAIIPHASDYILAYFDEHDADLRHVAQDFLQNRHEESVS
jgi:HEAT repeat protein